MLMLAVIGCVAGAVAAIIAACVWLSLVLFPTPAELKRKR